jgi:hypothetical protein
LLGGQSQITVGRPQRAGALLRNACAETIYKFSRQIAAGKCLCHRKYKQVIRQKYLTNPDFDPDKIKVASTACEGLCRWLLAIEKYDIVAKVVAPKKIALKVAEDALAGAMNKLEAKRQILRQVQGELVKLQDNLEVNKHKKVRDSHCNSVYDTSVAHICVLTCLCLRFGTTSNYFWRRHLSKENLELGCRYFKCLDCVVFQSRLWLPMSNVCMR